MDIDIDIMKSAQENANDYFSMSKKAKRKKEGAIEALKDLEKRLAEHEKAGKENAPVLKKVEKQEWYEKFRWFFASDGSLAIGGRDARQNEIIVGRYFEDKDLFFHADIFGASVVVLKDGTYKNRGIKEEVAQFAACYSRAWEQSATVNVYSLPRSGVSKSTQKGSIGTGSFLLSGEREWFKDAKLELCAYVTGQEEGMKKLNIAPGETCRKLGIRGVLITPGNVKKSDAAKFISKVLDYNDLDKIMQALPAGMFSLVS